MKLSLRRPPWTALAVLAAMVLADQLSKTVVLAYADRLPVTIVGGLRLELVRNSGVSFSLFTGSGLVIVGVAAVVAVLLALFLLLPRPYSLPLAILLGGSLGNLIDRLRFDGDVIDFVAVYWWPRWNIADAAIVIGAALMVLTVLLGSSRNVRGDTPETGGSPPVSTGEAASPASDERPPDEAERRRPGGSAEGTAPDDR